MSSQMSNLFKQIESEIGESIRAATMRTDFSKSLPNKPYQDCSSSQAAEQSNTP